MCGIVALIRGISILQELSNAITEAQLHQAQLSQFQQLLSARGPDRSSHIKLDTGNGVHLLLASSLLQLRGSETASTPHQNPSTGDILLYNGEIFGGGVPIPPHTNDGAALLAALSTIPPNKNQENSGFLEQHIVEVLSKIRGPWAVVYWQASTETLFFGRDILGRRSLLVQYPRTVADDFIITSMLPMMESQVRGLSSFIELPPGIYSVKIGGRTVEQQRSIKHHEWLDPELKALSTLTRAPGNFFGGPSREESCQKALQVLRQSMYARCSTIDTVNHHDNDGNHKLNEQQQQQTRSTSNGNASDGVKSSSNISQGHILKQLRPASVLILLSGGVDSTLIAALAHEVLPPNDPIDLATICFSGNGSSPDRLAALDALEELRCFAPEREWRLIAVDRCLQDIDEIKERLLTLLAPSDTIMDYNIGAALWMAAQGSGYVLRHVIGPKTVTAVEAAQHDDNNASKVQYTSAARVILLGHGADELFGGYGRHRTRYRAAGWEGLSDELDIDLKRLWVRNLGRDDRLIADSGREARHPFLDERVVKFALETPLSSLVDMELPAGEGDKRVLRDALKTLGLERAATRVKRAIQFGSRLAKQANLRDFGGTRQANARSADNGSICVLGSVKFCDHSISRRGRTTPIMAGLEPALSVGADSQPGLQEVNLSAAIAEKLAAKPVGNNLRLAALNNLAQQKAAGDTSGTASPLISARQAIPNNPSAQSSPTRLPAAASTDNGSQGGLPPQHALERQNSGEGGANGRHRSRSPSKFSSASRAPAERADSDAPSGLDFLLQACDMLEPEDNVTSKPRPVGRPARKNGGQRPRRFSDDGEYAPGDSSEDEEYRPSRANRAARRAQGGGDGSRLASAAPASAKWERGMVHGPCTNPDCEHPEDSPQWRKGPAQYPVLCNACGTRWLRNGTLKPLVPRRGIRYNRSRARGPRGNRSSAANSGAAPTSTYEEYGEEPLPESSLEGAERMPPGHSPAELPQQQGNAPAAATAGMPPQVALPINPLPAAQPLNIAAPPTTEAVEGTDPAQQATALAAAMANALHAAPFLQGFNNLLAGSLEQQLAAVTAAAQAAQQALAAAAAAANCQPQQVPTVSQPSSLTLSGAPLQKPSPFEDESPTKLAQAASVFNITAVAAGAGVAPAPLFKSAASVAPIATNNTVVASSSPNVYQGRHVVSEEPTLNAMQID